MPTFCDCLFCEKASLWPGSKGVARKKHRSSYFGLRISDFGFFCFPFSIRIPQSTIRNLEAGLSGGTQFGIRNVEFGILFFFLTIPHSAFYIPHFGCPPNPENEPCLMIFARNALAFGPGNGRNSIGFATTGRRVRVGKEPGEVESDPQIGIMR
jgi:hypothetical protein